ncbi:MAG: RHS repeat-associated core domain-containing protein [Gammaproteobacteria bacterium]
MAGGETTVYLNPRWGDGIHYEKTTKASGLIEHRHYLYATAPIAAATTHHGYTGHEHLDGLGLIHMNARVYDPAIGRFLQADPIGFEGGLNLYGYADGNPTSMVDLSGQETGYVSNCSQRGTCATPQTSFSVVASIIDFFTGSNVNRVSIGCCGPQFDRSIERLTPELWLLMPIRAGTFASGVARGASELAAFEAYGIKAERVLSGANDKVAVIGRTMGNAETKGVRGYAEALRNQGYNVDIFDGSLVSDAAQREFAQLTAGGRRLTNQELFQTQMYQENKLWAAKIKTEGYTVIDLGYPSMYSFSPFYTMEKQTIFSGGK